MTKRSNGQRLPDAVVVGVDVGGTKILVGFVDEAGIVHGSQRYLMDGATQESTLSCIESAVDDFLRSPRDGPAPLAMGLGLVGQTDPATGVWIRAMNLQVYTPVPLGPQLSERYGLPVRIDNDVHAATLTELRLGAGREFTDFIYLNVGTGIACGMVCNGQLVRGAVNYAGELGHMVVETDGDLCEQCGRRGCLEPIASGGGMLDQVRAGLVDCPDSLLHEPATSGYLTAGTIFEAADAGDALASAVAERAMRALGLALVNLLNLLNPEIVLLGGGVARNRWAIARLRAHVSAKALPAAAQALKGIVPSQFVDQVGLVGAATLVWQHRADW